ncbi:hypothetical protein DICPUDRAFT_77082 [Dictyostelium purpureum]|uniref:Phosphatidylinositol N-acetylglucosaminyltransferase subunit H conserved domain-containing protein n=1 Tax=Dictyostelium purpureum TaxID=5786 RepID=F0ZFJ4_DICPU|nr:uncharacterized protein DICPUDRAFT_77082 [Dictyostelium purpureum]EGC37305.1 hypothetical protein DICPUDRAFT_77082 [Dictyostelium purpureum]|eukprot:XP_003286193.1 hypothetical protein DICPUDRAFT_77082 [Dictyostelium purpureum]
MDYSCIPINNDVREYRVSRKSTSIFTFFDWFLLFTFFCTIIKHQYYNQSLFKSFSTYFLILLILFRFYLKLFIVKEESLIVMRELGVQLRRKYILRPERVEFIEKNKIEQIVINEGIAKHNVIFYMAFIVEGKNKAMVLAFEDLIPRIHILLKIYRGTSSFLYTTTSSSNVPTTTTTNATTTTTTISSSTSSSLNISTNSTSNINPTINNINTFSSVSTSPIIGNSFTDDNIDSNFHLK